MKPIAVIYNDFPEKFGLPRQSGMAPDLVSRIVMEKPYRVAEAFRGIETVSHLWLLWEFEPLGNKAAVAGEETGATDDSDEPFTPTVRPPKLGGNTRMGVFATRSPNRPNRIGLSAVKLISIEMTEDEGPVLYVAGGDMKSGTKILDIKPYIPFADSIPEATSTLYGRHEEDRLQVEVAEDLSEDIAKAWAKMSDSRKKALFEILQEDPRPGYQEDESRVYRMSYAELTVAFTVKDGVLSIIELS